MPPAILPKSTAPMTRLRKGGCSRRPQDQRHHPLGLARHGFPAQVRLYDALFTKRAPEDVEEGRDYKENLNPGSLEIINDACCEPALKNAAPGSRVQFERLGYFFADPKIQNPGLRSSTAR